MQHRQVLCRQNYANRTLNVHTSHCQNLERPDAASTCQLKICSEWQIRSEWTAVSDESALSTLFFSGGFSDLIPASCLHAFPVCRRPPQCSVPCGHGQRTREVHCVSNLGDFVPDEECNMNLRPSDVENCDMGACARSWFYTDWGNTVGLTHTVMLSS